MTLAGGVHWAHWRCKMCRPGYGDRVSPGGEVLAHIREHVDAHMRAVWTLWR